MTFTCSDSGTKWKLGPRWIESPDLPESLTYSYADSPPVWLPKPAPTIDRPTDLPAPVTISEVLRKDDPGPVSWKPIQPGQLIEDLGVYDSRFVFYRAKFTKGDKPIPPGGLNISPKIESGSVRC